ncbi:MAG: Gfo/Idh/MocA family oxidoreductase [Bacteroidales bacterium]|nr:Gfo/Idh/MocA family oxidoreductase [Bacteroidales bacterium]
MNKNLNRRNFVKTAAVGGIGLGLAGNFTSLYGKSIPEGKRIGIIGLDTSHSVAYTKTLNSPDAGPEFSGFKIVAAYPKGSNDIKSSVDRIPGYTEEVKKYGVEIVNSIEELISKVDVVLLETNDGRLHREQAIPVLKAGKRMFIDKPVAASLTDAIAIFDTAKKYNVPVFSSSSLRYIAGAQEIAHGSIGKVLGADTYSPSPIEKTHPDLFWYGIHGVETLFTLMGKGCKSVSRTFTDNTDVVVGVWQDNRIGTFRGIRSGKGGYGGTAFGEKGIQTLGEFKDYNTLLIKIIEFFNTGKVPVPAEDTLEIFAFMEAAQVSKLKKGASVDIESVMAKAKKNLKK